MMAATSFPNFAGSTPDWRLSMRHDLQHNVRNRRFQTDPYFKAACSASFSARTRRSSEHDGPIFFPAALLSSRAPRSLSYGVLVTVARIARRVVSTDLVVALTICFGVPAGRISECMPVHDEITTLRRHCGWLCSAVIGANFISTGTPRMGSFVVCGCQFLEQVSVSYARSWK